MSEKCVNFFLALRILDSEIQRYSAVVLAAGRMG